MSCQTPETPEKNGCSSCASGGGRHGTPETPKWSEMSFDEKLKVSNATFRRIQELIPKWLPHLFSRALYGIPGSPSDALRSLFTIPIGNGITAKEFREVAQILLELCQTVHVLPDMKSTSSLSGKTIVDYIVGNLKKLKDDVSVKDAVVPALLLLEHGAGHEELSKFVATLPPGELHTELNDALRG